MIGAWRAGEIGFQFRLALFVISQRLELRLAPGGSKWSLKRNMINSGGKEVCHKEMRSSWCGVLGGQGECWWRWRSAEWSWGVQIQPRSADRDQEEHIQQRSLSMLSSAKRGGRQRVWNEIEVLLIKVEEGIEELPSSRMSVDRNGSMEHESRPRSANPVWGAPTALEERQWGLRSANKDWGAPTRIEERQRGSRSANGIEEHVIYPRSTMGGYEAAPPSVIDESNGFGSNTIYHCGRTKFTLIFILRKPNCNLLSSGILRQCTINSCSNKR